MIQDKGIYSGTYFLSVSPHFIHSRFGLHTKPPQRDTRDISLTFRPPLQPPPIPHLPRRNAIYLLTFSLGDITSSWPNGAAALSGESDRI